MEYFERTLAVKPVIEADYNLLNEIRGCDPL